MNQTVNPQNWADNVSFIVSKATAGLDFQIVGYHHAQRSESIYLNLLKDGRLYQLRYSWHHEAQTFAQLKSFNLSLIPDDRRLIQASRNFLKKPSNGITLTYFHFAGLSLVEKLAQVEFSPLTYHDQQFYLDDHAVSAYLSSQLDFLWQHRLILIKFRTKQVFLSQSGRELLDYYWEVADAQFDVPQWDFNPRTALPEELLKILAD